MRFIILRFWAGPTSSGCVLLHSVESSFFVCALPKYHLLLTRLCQTWTTTALLLLIRRIPRMRIRSAAYFAKLQLQQLVLWSVFLVLRSSTTICKGMWDDMCLPHYWLDDWWLDYWYWWLIIDLFSHILRFVAHQLCDMTWQWHSDAPRFWPGCPRHGHQLWCCCWFVQFGEWGSIQHNLQNCNSSNLVLHSIKSVFNSNLWAERRTYRDRHRRPVPVPVFVTVSLYTVYCF